MGCIRKHLISSRLLEYEVWNRVHAYSLVSSHGPPTGALLMGIELLEMDRRVLARALEPWPVTIRMLDSLHLATIALAVARRLGRVGQL